MLGRLDVLQSIIFARNARSYLEVGLGDGHNFKTIQCLIKVGVDVVPSESLYPLPPTVRVMGMTSDRFFLSNREYFDVIFIDGYQSAKQVECDIDGAIEALAPGGVIVVRDLSVPAVGDATLRYGNIDGLDLIIVSSPDGMLGVIERKIGRELPTIQDILRGRYSYPNRLENGDVVGPQKDESGGSRIESGASTCSISPRSFA
jgi:hypothetical protein